MTRRTLTDEEISEALLYPGDGRKPACEGTGASERNGCIHEDRLWDLACGALDPDLAGRILDHTLECPDCSLALRVARETFAVSQAAPETPRTNLFLTEPWGRLAGSVLRPAPAFVYLVLLLLSFPLYRILTTNTPVPVPIGGSVPPAPNASGAGTPPAPVSPTSSGVAEPAAPSGPAALAPAPMLRSLRILRITGDLSLRGGATQSAPLRIHLGEAEALVLKLFPDVEDLPRSPSAALLVRVLDGETVVAATTRHVTDLEQDQSLSVLLDRPLRSGTTYRIELTAGPPATGPGGVPTHSGQETTPAPPILRRSFLLE